MTKWLNRKISLLQLALCKPGSLEFTGKCRENDREARGTSLVTWQTSKSADTAPWRWAQDSAADRAEYSAVHTGLRKGLKKMWWFVFVLSCLVGSTLGTFKEDFPWLCLFVSTAHSCTLPSPWTNQKKVKEVFCSLLWPPDTGSPLKKLGDKLKRD